MTPKVWFAVDVTVSPNAADAVEEAMADLADLGTSLDTLKRSESESVVITGFFSEPADLAEIRSHLDTTLGIHEISSDTIRSIELRTFEDADRLVKMNGREVFKFATRVMVSSAEALNLMFKEAPSSLGQSSTATPVGGRGAVLSSGVRHRIVMVESDVPSLAATPMP